MAGAAPKSAASRCGLHFIGGTACLRHEVCALGFFLETGPRFFGLASFQCGSPLRRSDANRTASSSADVLQIDAQSADKRTQQPA